METGSLVRPIGGGSLMKIESIRQREEGLVALCVWYDNMGAYLQREFPMERLEVVQPGPDSPPTAP